MELINLDDIPTVGKSFTSSVFIKYCLNLNFV